MGALQGCMKGKGSLDFPGKQSASEDQKRFDALIKAVDVPESDKKYMVYFKYTKLPSIDKIILQAQETVTEIHKVRYSLIKGIEKIVHRAGVYRIAGADTSHAILAIVYAIAAQNKGAASEDFITFGAKFPYIKMGKDSAVVNTAKDSKILADYFLCLEQAYQKMPKLLEDCVDIAKKAESLKDDAQSDLERIDKFSLPTTTAAIKHNTQMLKNSSLLATSTMNLVKKTAVELEATVEVLKIEHAQLPEFGKILADEGITDPVECYERVGKKIMTDKKPVTIEEFLTFSYLPSQQVVVENGGAQHDEED